LSDTLEKKLEKGIVVHQMVTISRRPTIRLGEEALYKNSLRIWYSQATLGKLAVYL